MNTFGANRAPGGAGEEENEFLWNCDIPGEGRGLTYYYIASLITVPPHASMQQALSTSYIFRSSFIHAQSCNPGGILPSGNWKMSELMKDSGGNTVRKLGSGNR
jgi:hypothetical protein